MGHMLEVSPSGRAKCRGCKESVAKGDVRFCESFDSAFSDGESFRYWHLKCAAKRLPIQLKAAMDAYTDDIPDKDAVLAEITAAGKKAGGRGGAKLPFPHADIAPTGRARCMI